MRGDPEKFWEYVALTPLCLSATIVIAAFLVREGRGDAQRSMWLGVGCALALCVAFGVAISYVAVSLPQSGAEICSASTLFA